MAKTPGETPGWTGGTWPGKDNPLPNKVFSGTVPAHWYNLLIDRAAWLETALEGCDRYAKEQEREVAKLKKRVEEAEESVGYHRKNRKYWDSLYDKLVAAEEKIKLLEAGNADLKAKLKKCEDEAKGPASFRGYKARQAARAGRAGVRGGGGLYNNHDCAAEIAAAVAAAGTTFPSRLYDVTVGDDPPFDVLVAAASPAAATAYLTGLPGGNAFSYLVNAGWLYDATEGGWLDLPLL